MPRVRGEGELVIDSVDHGLSGYDGSYPFLHNVVLGRLYAVAAIAVVNRPLVSSRFLRFV